MRQKNKLFPHFTKSIFAILILLFTFFACDNSSGIKPDTQQNTGLFVTIKDDKLIKDGKEFHPMGYNLGNYLLLENFMVGMPGTYSQMLRVVDDVMGKKRADEFWKTYEENYTTEKDIKYISELGMNFIRVPFNQNRFVDQNDPEKIDPALWSRLDSIVAWSKKYNISVLLDLHAVPGGQSLSNYADAETGDVLFWSVSAFRKNATDLWVKIADHFKNEPTIFGYGLLNESNTYGHTEILTQWLQETINAIRTVDKQHIIVVSGEGWGKSMWGLNEAMFEDPQVMPEIHFYGSFIGLGSLAHEYPTVVDGVKIDKSRIENWMDTVTQPNYGRPILVGECGAHWDRSNVDDQVRLMKDMMEVLKERNMGWSMWSYKDVGAMGLMHPKKETAWIKYRNSDYAKNINKSYRDIVNENWDNVEETGAIHEQLLKFRGILHDDDIHKKAQGINRRMEEVALRAMLDPMKDYSQEELNSIAASFSFDNCEPYEIGVEFIKSIIQD